MDRIVAAAIEACRPGGHTHQYFLENAVWEFPMRARFASIPNLLCINSSDADEKAQEELRYLNGAYRARYAVQKIPIVYSSIKSIVEATGWWCKAPPNLLLCSDEEVMQIADTLVRIIFDTARKGGDRPYSLSTKFLHFCFPETFAIFDSQVAKSVNAWAIDVFGASDHTSPNYVKFMPNLIDTASGQGYYGLLKFYQALWEEVESSGKSGELYDASVYLSAEASKASGVEDVQISITDIFDKHLWKSAGDLIKLGLKN